ncbi:N-acetylglucosamine-6-phosphate deacetylase [Agrococcus casei]|uniref:N-acetylglucosamine-6-phosphate deacetylase n=1 Tax=Agrococcus casei TaxID=343512 RepID=UPI003F8F5606
MRTLIHSVQVHGSDADWLLIEDGLVRETGKGDAWRSIAGLDGVDAAVVDGAAVAGEGALLAPGFIDLHTHGGGGFAHEEGADAIRSAREFHRRHGTTSAVVSLVTDSADLLAERVAEIAGLSGELGGGELGILGSHLEGPFLSDARRGAHDASQLRAPDAVLQRLLEAGSGTVRQVTLAPELDGGLDAVRAIVDAGAVCAIGHTEADRDLTARAFDAGATLLTHAFNAMAPLLHRSPGPVGAALSDDRVVIELIADGVHVHPDLLRMVFAAAPGRVALVTDAMVAAGAADGDYVLGSLDVVVTDGVARLREGGAIAGSTLTQDAAVRQAVAAGVPVSDAIAAVTTTPARVLGVDLGILSAGRAADAVLLTSDLQVRAVWSAGEAVAL